MKSCPPPARVPALAFALSLLAAGAVAAPAQLPPESRQFDFWLGSWDVNLRIRQEDGTWPDSVAARARIYPVLNGKAVLELWDSPDIVGFSLRYYDAARAKWALWLNWPGANRSGSSGLEGAFRHGRGEFFATRKQPDGGEILSRYTFSDITADSLRWDDAFSGDGGATWRHKWIMEFTRTGPTAALPQAGGPAPTWHDGSRCDLAPFRRFAALSGRRRGSLEEAQGDGFGTPRPALLTGYEILDGCAVLAHLAVGEGAVAGNTLMLLTWNTYADVFEASVLDDGPDSPLRVLYGKEQDGGITLTQPADPERGSTRRQTWTLGEDGIRLLLEESVDQGASWRPVARLDLPQKSK